MGVWMQLIGRAAEASGRGGRGRAFRAARAGAVRAGHAVLVALRPEGLDVGVAGDAMTKPEWFQSSQMQALNPLLVMLLIPFNNLVLYPALKNASAGTR
jgi:hypothetical protein